MSDTPEVTRAASSTFGMCTASYRGRNIGCPHPRVESADSSLCARHLLIAANDVKQIGGAYLAEVIRQEESR